VLVTILRGKSTGNPVLYTIVTHWKKPIGGTSEIFFARIQDLPHPTDGYGAANIEGGLRMNARFQIRPWI